jgi:hypothetical protein
MRRSRFLCRDNDTLTESCEGAVNFMVIEMKDRSFHLRRPMGPFGCVDGVVKEEWKGWVPPSFFFFVFYRSFDQPTD